MFTSRLAAGRVDFYGSHPGIILMRSINPPFIIICYLQV